MRSSLLGPLLLALASSPVLAQTPRSPVEIDGDVQATTAFAGLATSGDLTAAQFTAGTSAVGQPSEIYVTFSDGRGLDWSTPRRVDGGTSLQNRFVPSEPGEAIAVEGDSIYVVWADQRASMGSSQSDVYFARSMDRGLTFEPELRLDFGAPQGVQRTSWISLEVVGSDVYVLVATDLTGGSDNGLYLLRSNDGGASFGQPQTLSSMSGSSTSVLYAGLECLGSTVVAVWLDDRTAPNSFASDVFFRVSNDGGTSFGPETRPNGSAVGTSRFGKVQGAIVGSTIFITWWEETLGLQGYDLRGVLSVDDGQTFGPDFRVGNAAPASSSALRSDVAIVGGALLTTQRDGGSPPYGVIVSRSTDLGLTWIDTEVMPEGPEPQFAWTDRDPTESSIGVVASVTQFSPLEWQTSLVASRDGGASWSSPTLISAAASADLSLNPVLNSRYDNFIVGRGESFSTGPATVTNVIACGLRPQTAQLSSRVSGSIASFDLRGWEPGTTRFVWVFGSNSMSGLPVSALGGRLLGLALDGLFNVTLLSPATFLTPLDASGSGATGSFLLNLPPGSTFFQAAVSFDVGPITAVEISDAVEVTVQ